MMVRAVPKLEPEWDPAQSKAIGKLSGEVTPIIGAQKLEPAPMDDEQGGIASTLVAVAELGPDPFDQGGWMGANGSGQRTVDLGGGQIRLSPLESIVPGGNQISQS